MLHVFNDKEGIRIAIEMEKRGESFYRHAARIAREPQTVKLLGLLADDENVHRQEFEKLAKTEAIALSCASYDDETNAFLSAVAAEFIFPKGLMGLRDVGFEDPASILDKAIESEKNSILFYTKLEQSTQDPHAQHVFAEIIGQESNHLCRLQQQKQSLDRRSKSQF